MRQLLQYETRKLFSAKSFWICCGALAAMTLMGLVSAKISQVVGTHALTSVPDTSNIPAAFFDHLSGRFLLVSSLHSMVPAALSILIAILVCFDFSQKTVRNVIAMGYSRANIFFSKLLVCMLAAVIYSCANVLFACALGSMLWGFGGTVTVQIFMTLVTQLLLIFSMTSGYLMFAIVIRNPGIAIVVCIFGSSIIGYTFSLFDAIVQSFGLNIAISSYHLPKLLASISILDASNSQLIKAAICAVLSIIVLNVISVITFCKRDA